MHHASTDRLIPPWLPVRYVALVDYSYDGPQRTENDGVPQLHSPSRMRGA